MPISEFYSSVTYGFQLETRYKHEKTNADIMAVVYNNRLRGFVILDTRGIVTCKLNPIGLKVDRVLLYPKYKHRVITLLQYVKKYNCYFVLDKEFVVKILNKDFEEVYSMDSETIGASFMVFNSVTDELFTGGVGGTKIWQFHKMSAEMFNEIKHLSNYRLTKKTTLPKVGGCWVQKIEVNPTIKHLYCSSEMSVHVYNMDGKLLHHFEQAHTMKITGCCYCHKSRVFATSSWDTTVKIWGLNGSLLHTFRGHSKPISNLILHPKNPFLLVTSSFDGTIKIWSLETLEQIYSLPVYAGDGPMWMFLTEENTIVVFNPQEIKLWSLNHFINFWNLTRCQIFHMSLQPGNSPKSTRLMAVGKDSSLRLFSRKSGKKLCTVLPPPCLSPLERLVDFCYSREMNLVYVLLNPDTIWIYTSKTDPACRLAKWNTKQLQKKEAVVSNFSKKPPPDFVAESSQVDACQCTAICILRSHIVITTDTSHSSPDCQEFLLLGLEDGRILFMDLIIKGHKYYEFKASKDAITALYHDKMSNSLVTQCQLTDHKLIQIWGLPYLQLQFAIPCLLNLTTWTRLDCVLLTGYKDGNLFWHRLARIEENGTQNPKIYPSSDFKQGKATPHQAEILSVDACHARSLLTSCSSDGNIKIWEESGTLVREIILDDSVASVCFLNAFGDLLVSFQSHIYCIPHSKVCPHQIGKSFENTVSSAEESDIYEDPSITTDDWFQNKEEKEGMKSYLVPYQMDFSKFFLPGTFSKMTAELVKETHYVHNEERRLEQAETLDDIFGGAPTELYLSPREPLMSGSWSSTSFVSYTGRRLGSFGDLDWPELNTSAEQSHSSQSSRTDALNEFEDINKDQAMIDLGALEKKTLPVCPETTKTMDPFNESKMSQFETATHEFVPSTTEPVFNKQSRNRPSKENRFTLQALSTESDPPWRDIIINTLHIMENDHQEMAGTNEGDSTTRSLSERHTSQSSKKNPFPKKRKKKCSTQQNQKQTNDKKRERKCEKERCYDNKTKDESVSFLTKEMENNHLSLMAPGVKDTFSATDTSQKHSLFNVILTTMSTTAKGYSYHEMPSGVKTLNEEQNVSEVNEIQNTQAINYSQKSNDRSRRHGSHLQIATKKKKKIKKRGKSKGDNNENIVHKRKEIEKENKASKQRHVNNSRSLETTDYTKATSVKSNKSLTSRPKNLDLSSGDNPGSYPREKPDHLEAMKYTSMTVKGMPGQNEEQTNKGIKKECFLRSKDYHLITKYSQIHQPEDEIRLKKPGTTHIRTENNSNIPSSVKSEDEKVLDERQKQIERLCSQVLSKNLPSKDTNQEHGISEINKGSSIFSGNLTYEDGKIFGSYGSKFSKHDTVRPIPHVKNFTKSKIPILPILRNGFNQEKERCTSAPVLVVQNKYISKDYTSNISSMAWSKSKPSTSQDGKPQSSNKEILKTDTSTIIEKQKSLNYRINLEQSEAITLQRPNTSSSQVSNLCKKQAKIDSYLKRTKSIPENLRPSMKYLGTIQKSNYRFPTPLEVRLMSKRFPKMCARVIYQHLLQPQQPRERISSTPLTDKHFLTHGI